MLALTTSYVLSPRSAQWGAVLDSLPHDVYHSAEYSTLSGFGQEGEAMAFVYQEDGSSFLWPYLLKPIEGAPGFYDAGSVYGYPGPAGTAEPEFLARAWEALLEQWRSQGVVSAFTRFHPMLNNHELLTTIPAARGGLRECGNTVSIDLTLPLEAQAQQIHRNMRADIRKGREAGLITSLDADWKHIAEFVAAYQDTMARCGSRPEYVVDEQWVSQFRETIGANAHLFVTKQGEAVAAAMIVITYGPFVHCHLIGTAPEFAALSPSKVMFDDVRQWGSRNGYATMHLGGGLGGREDALFQFKRKFSPRTHMFRTGSWILDEAKYRSLDAENRTRLAEAGIEAGEISYFPAYRYRPA